MSFENIVFAVICLICSMFFGAIALWAFKRKDPMHFWSGSTVKPEEISDIPSYNRANGWMWGVYAGITALTGVLSLFSMIVGVILLVIICVPGIAFLVITYKKIYSKYRNTSSTDSSSSARIEKTPKSVIIAMTSIFVVLVVTLGFLFFYGEKEPDISISEQRIEIKALYGLSIDYKDIKDIYIIRESMSDIGVGSRVNGYAATGETLKGHFKSDALGEKLLFVRTETSPVIKIERHNGKDVYISLKDSESTSQLYRDMMLYYMLSGTFCPARR